MKTLSLILMFFVTAPLPAMGANGAFEINQDCAQAGCFAGDSAGFPVTITQPGSYVLTSDLLVSSGNDGIDIQASPVDLDLNGHSLNGGGSCTGTPVTSCTGAVGSDGIALMASATGHIRVHNGTVRGFGNGGITGADDGDGVVLEHLTFAENVGDGANLFFNSNAGIVQVRDSTFVRNSPSGLFGNVSLNIENCTFAGNQNAGAAPYGGGTIANSRFQNNGKEGIYSVQPNAISLDHDVFNHNNGGSAQWSFAPMLDMGGNVCTDHACP